MLAPTLLLASLMLQHVLLCHLDHALLFDLLKLKPLLCSSRYNCWVKKLCDVALTIRW